MARPRSDERRNSILVAATRVIASHGLGASTAAIAKEAGVSNGSLFVYFGTKVALLNELYVLLKIEMGDASVVDLPTQESPRDQVRHMWRQWLRWATSNPEKRRTLSYLEVADEITDISHQAVRDAQGSAADLVEISRADGPMADVPLQFVMVLIGTLADATMDAMIREPEHADTRCEVAFEAVWRVLAG